MLGRAPSLTQYAGCRSAVILAGLGVLVASCQPHRSPNPERRPPMFRSERMADGKRWTVENLNLRVMNSYCYDDAEANCVRSGRLYTWTSAGQGCRLLGAGWRLPTDDDWRQLARQYGGVFEDSNDSGRVAYRALLIGGASAFNAALGGGRSRNGTYARSEAHGFYWTASESDSGAWFYNFGHGSLALYRQSDGDKEMAMSVRCLKE